MDLDVAGHPLHTRALAVTLLARADAKIDVRGCLLDLRKRGFVPVGGDLQGPGIIHHMLLDALVDPASATLESIVAAQPAVAFEPSVLSAGESCRDPIDRIRELAGARLDDRFPRGVSAAVGGPRGCSHILALAHLLGSTAAWALPRDRAAHGPTPSRPVGQRIFRRDVIVDGHQPAPGRLLLALQLTDLHFAPSPLLARPMDRFAGELEVRALAEVDLQSFTIVRLTGAERRRGIADLDGAPWRTRDNVMAPLVGLSLGPGVTAALVERLSGTPEDRPVLDALLTLAPTVIQCVATLSETWPRVALSSDSRLGIGGLPDSCYMWRRGGALIRARDEGGRVAVEPPRG